MDCARQSWPRWRLRRNQFQKFPPLTAPLAAVMATVIKLWTNLFDDDDDIAYKETNGQEK